MASLAQTPDGDIDVTGGRTRIVRGAEEKAQKIRNRLRLFQGEWFLDTRVGVPWFKVVFGVKNPDLEIIKRLFERVILSVPGVASVDDVTIEFNRATREMTYSFLARDDEGVEIDGASIEPFIVEV